MSRWTHRAWGRSEGVWDPVSRTEGEAIHDMIEHVAGLDWSTGKIGMIGDVTLLLEPVERGADSAAAPDVPWR